MPTCLYTTCMPVESRMWPWVPRNWNYGWLWVIIWVLETEPRSTRAADVLKGWVISLAPKDQFYLEFPLIVLGYCMGGYFFIQKQIKLALRIKAIHIQTICKCSIKRTTLGMGRGLEVKSTCWVPSRSQQQCFGTQRSDTFFWEGKEMRKGEERMEGKGESKGKRKWRSQVETRL